MLIILVYPWEPASVLMITSLYQSGLPADVIVDDFHSWALALGANPFAR
jgi:hypothetical protein